MTYRSSAGAEYSNVMEIPCLQLADYLDPDAMTDDEEVARDAEIRRRGAVFLDHIGRGHVLPGWGEIPVVGCDHTADGSEG
jgi:hypothetical protein